MRSAGQGGRTFSTPRGSLRVLVASNSAERSQGLSRRDDLPGDGLLLQWNAHGRRSGVTERELKDVEAGPGEMLIDTLSSLAEGLNVGVAFLFCDRRDDVH